MITSKNFKKVLELLHYVTTDNKTYIKIYNDNTDSKFEFKAIYDVSNDRFDFEYPPKLKYDRGTTEDSHQQESFVVFECITRLFDVGYKPENLKLEGKNYQGQKLGWIDILLKDNTGTEYLIIECKNSDSETKNDEFTTHWNKTLNNGDQLFRYFNTFSKAQYLCMYTADFVNDELVDNYNVITLKDNDEYLESNKKLKSYKWLRENQGSSDEFFEVWKNTYGLDYSTNGIIEEDCKPFDIGKKKISIKDLKEIDYSAMQKKYNEFATILRKYNVSSKENAFDKLVNLFLAKIVDETYNQSELKCLWKGAAYDNYFDMQDRLQSLYKKGMEEFFQDTVAYVENNEINEAFSFLKSNADEAKRTILEYFRTLKYYNNNPFAFLDVHNESLFYQNAVILKEIVNMIQDIKIKTNSQNQFLGDLFEGFLDQGIKQSEGQFFTPMPIVKFLISSLPLETLISESAEIPKVIDYACGAGHFLTEYANQIKPFVEKYNKAELSKYYSQIHGIEKEYRLSKVSQVSAFMYGQDDIKILYKDALVKTPEVKDGTYSVLVANPPYSVKGFLQTLDDSDRENYELFTDNLNVDSNNSIETFFVERARQLLKPNGIAAIILPSSVLEKDNIYNKSREIILKYFDIVAIFESGSGTFGKTGTHTATLFLRKRIENPSISEHYANRVDTWFSGNFEDDKFYEDFNLVEKYCSYCEYNLEDYKTIFTSHLSEKLLNIELFAEYKNAYENDMNGKKYQKKISDITNKEIKGKYTQETQIKELEATKKAYDEYVTTSIQNIEKEKLYYFMLANSNNKVLVIETPAGTTEVQKFLGYKWSAKKGDEGIKYLNVAVEKSKDDEIKDDTMQQVKGIEGIRTKLFNPQDLNDETKINMLVRKNFLGELTSVPEGLKDEAKLLNLTDMIDFRGIEFDKKINTGVKVTYTINTRYPTEKLDKIANIEYGTRITKSNVTGDTYPVYGGGGETFRNGEYNREDRYIISRFGMSPECVRFVTGKFFLNDSGLTISSKSPEIDNIFINEFLFINQNVIYSMGRGTSQKNLDIDAFKALQIPIIPKEIQSSINKECTLLDDMRKKNLKLIKECKNTIDSILNDINNSDYEIKEVGKICTSTEYGTSEKSLPEGKVPVIRMGNIIDGKIDMHDLVYTNNEDDIKKLMLKKYDVLFNRTNSEEHVGKVGIYLSDEPAVFAGYLVRINYIPEIINPIYLCNILNSKKIREYGFSVMVKSVHQSNINAEKLSKYKIPVPPLAEQEKIVKQINKLEEKIADAQKENDSIPQKRKEILAKWLE